MSELPQGVVLDDDVDPDEIERYGADSRADDVNVDALRAEAERESWREVDDEGEQ